jgi:ABC-2 type transport system ATP-binding protein
MMVAELRDATKRYGKVTALEPLTLGIEPGRVTALLGPNGAGKTTTVKLMLGLTRPTSGSVRLFGADPMDAASRRRTGAMLQVANVPETLRVREHVHLFSSYYPSPLSLEAVLASAGLTSIADRKYGELSGGQKQRVQFALAICGDPELLFLDEPTVGLDVEARRAFWQEVRRLTERGRAILLTTHYLEEADALADRVIVINEGRVVADATPSALKSLAAARRIRCVTTMTLDRIEAIAAVRSARRDGVATEILTSHAEDVCRHLLAVDAGLTGLEISGAGLEEAFLSIVAQGRPAPVYATAGGGR